MSLEQEIKEDLEFLNKIVEDFRKKHGDTITKEMLYIVRKHLKRGFNKFPKNE